MADPNAESKAKAAAPPRFGYGLSIAGVLISRLATLAVLILLPREIGLTDYGMFALVITLGEIIEMTSSNWYRLLLVRQSVNASTAVPANKQGLPIWTLIAAAGALAFMGAFALSPMIVSTERGAFTAAVGAYIFAFVCFRLLVTLMQAQGRQNLIGIVELLRGILTLSFVLAAVKFGAATFVFASAGLIVATFLTALCGLPAIGKGLGALLRQRLEPGSFAAIGIPVIIATMLTYQFGWIDRLVLQHWMGPQTVGLYVAVIAIARQPVDLVLNALNSQTFPVLMARGSQSDPATAEKITGVLLSLCIMGFGTAAAIIALADPLVRFALPTFDHSTAIALVPLIAAGAVALGLKHFVFDNIFHAHGRNWIMLRWFAFVAMATLALTIVLVPAFGPAGAAVAFLLGSIGALASSVHLSRRFCAVRWPLPALARVTLSAVLAATAAWLASSFDFTPWLRLCVGAGVFGAIYLLALTLILNFRLGAFLSSPWNIDGLRGAAS